MFVINISGSSEKTASPVLASPEPTQKDIADSDSRSIYVGNVRAFYL